MTPEPAIELENLSKSFGEKVAVAGLTLQVERGEVFGFLGPNGAGKTTALKMMLGLIRPSGGGGRVLGEPLGDPRTRARIGFLPEHFRFHEWLTAVEFLQLHADLYRVRRGEAGSRLEGLLERVGLAAHRQKRLNQFSKGMLQRIGLAQALLNDPDLVFLDEPTSGLDPGGRRLVRDIIGEIRSRGATVFLNSHLLSEVEITCDRVAFIKQGEVVRVTDLETWMEGERTVQIRAAGVTEAIRSALSGWGRLEHLDGQELVLALHDGADLAELNRYLVEQGVAVRALIPRQLSLEEMFIQTVGPEGGL